MKIVSDYMPFETYKDKVDEKVIPLFNAAIENAFDSEEYKQAKKWALAGYTTAGIGVLLILIAFIVFAAAPKGENLWTVIISGFVLIILGAILFFATVLIYRKYKRLKDLIFQNMEDRINVEKLYRDSFAILDPNFNFIGYKTATAKTAINQSAFQSHRYEVPDDAYVLRMGPEKMWNLDKKYPAYLRNAQWERVTTDFKGNRKTEHYYSCLLMIDTTNLGEKAFNFSLFNNQNHKKLYKKLFNDIKLENKEFNKVFVPRSDDDLKIRMMYTPLAMETSLKRFKDNKNSKVRKLSITSLGNYIYFEFSSDFYFMDLDWKPTLNKQKLFKSLYNDFIVDTYTFYYLISLIYIPLYLA